MLIVIALPHACSPLQYENEHFCEYTEIPVAVALKKSFDDAGVHSIILIPEGKENGLVCNLDRPWCRNAPFRKRLRKFIVKNKKNIKFVLDLHSFPEGDPRYGAAVVTILDNGYLSDIKIKPYSGDLAVKISSIGIPVYVGSSELNDIQDEMNEFGLESVSIEFNESLLRGQNRQDLHRLIHIIAEWLYQWNGKSNIQISTQIDKIS